MEFWVSQDQVSKSTGWNYSHGNSGVLLAFGTVLAFADGAEAIVDKIGSTLMKQSIGTKVLQSLCSS